MRVGAYNTRAIRCYLACGFVVEGRVRKTTLVAGKRRVEPIVARCAIGPALHVAHGRDGCLALARPGPELVGRLARRFTAPEWSLTKP